MNKKVLIAVFENELFMYVDEEFGEKAYEDQSVKCVVYNTKKKKISPEVSVGSWSARLNPWKLPTESQRKAYTWEKVVENAR